MKVEYITHNQEGNDLTVVNAARVSMDKHHKSFDKVKDKKLINYLVNAKPVPHWAPLAHPQMAFKFEFTTSGFLNFVTHRPPGCEILVEAQGLHYVDALIRGSLWFWIQHYPLLPLSRQRAGVKNQIVAHFPYTAKACSIKADPKGMVMPVPMRTFDDAWVKRQRFNNRLSTLAKIPVLTLRVTQPIPIRTQAYKHKYGGVESEISRRYVNGDPEFYSPEYWRLAAENVKQGSSDQVLSGWKGSLLESAYGGLKLASHGFYKLARILGVCPEQARFGLLQATETTWYWTGSVDFFARVYRQRIDKQAQSEVRALALGLNDIMMELFPETWMELTEEKK